MIYALPDQPFIATLENAPTGVLTMGVRILNRDGTTQQARSTSIVNETPAGAGLYIARFTKAPAEGGVYIVFWDNGTISPSTTSSEELTVTLEIPEAPAEHEGEGVIAGFVRSIIKETGIDASELEALKWLSSAHGLMCVRSKSLRRRLSLGNTVEGQTDYPVPPEVVEILEVTVGGVPYGSGRHTDIANMGQGWLWLSGPGGLSVGDYDAAGAAFVSLVTQGATIAAGEAVEIYAICRPAPLVVGTDSLVRVPEEFWPAIIDGALATGYKRTDGRFDLAGPHEEAFGAACVELERQTVRRLRGVGPRQARISGINA